MTNPGMEDNRQASKVSDAIPPVYRQKCQNTLSPEEVADLKKSSREIECLLSSLSSILIVISMQQEVNRFNPMAEKVLGQAAAEVIGRPLPKAASIGTGIK